MNKHSNTAPAVRLAEQLYNECPTPKPTWNQLVSYGATQSVWIERAEKLLTLADDAGLSPIRSQQM